MARHKWELFCAGLRMGEVENDKLCDGRFVQQFFSFCFYSKWEAKANH